LVSLNHRAKGEVKTLLTNFNSLENKEICEPTKQIDQIFKVYVTVIRIQIVPYQP